MLPYGYVKTTIAELCHLIDDGQFEAAAQLFTEDAVFESRSEVFTGRFDIRKRFEKSMPPEKRGKHLVMNSVVSVAGSSATVRSDFILLQVAGSGPTIRMAGRFDDELKKETDRWRISRRVITVQDGWISPQV